MRIYFYQHCILGYVSFVYSRIANLVLADKSIRRVSNDQILSPMCVSGTAEID